MVASEFLDLNRTSKPMFLVSLMIPKFAREASSEVRRTSESGHYGRLAFVGRADHVGMAERTARRDPVAHDLLQLLDLRKAALVLARPNNFLIDADLENAACRVRGEGHGANFLCKGCQQSLSHPAGAEAPAAQPAISDLDCGPLGHARLSSLLVGFVG
jgi:hypothetical protein